MTKFYEDLEKEFQLSSFVEKAEVITKIKEVNCNKEEMTKWIEEKKEKKPIPQEDEKVMKLYEELDQEFNLSSIVDKEEVIAKIKECNCDREKMNDWIFEEL